MKPRPHFGFIGFMPRSSRELINPVRAERDMQWTAFCVILVGALLLLAGCADQPGDTAPYSPRVQNPMCSREVHTWGDKRFCDRELASHMVTANHDFAFPEMYTPILNMNVGR